MKHKVSVVIPCFNEAESIAKVLRSFHKGMLAKDAFDFDLIVIDNSSTDDTAKIAERAGARVIHEPKQGKGYALRLGFASISKDTEYVVMMDGDNTYRPEEVLRLLEPLDTNFCDAVVGSRLGGKIRGDAMNRLNRGGNWAFTHLVRLIYHVNITDVLSGYFAWRREIIDELAPHLHSHGFAIEMEMITKMSRMGCRVYSVPITYEPRGNSSNLRPFHDGAKILRMLARNMRWNHPRQIEELEEET
jgi:dolichol-phosphate hexosyltransferase